MDIKRSLAAFAGAVGATATGNALLTWRAGDLDPPLSGTQRTYRWRGMDVAYSELGDPEAETVLLLHGMNAAGTSHEFEPIAAGLAERYHVVAPDFPGFGCSDRPPLAYDADLYTDFVREFADDVTPGAACLASSLSGSYAAVAQRETGVFSTLVLVCPTATTMGIRRRRLRGFLRAPVVGTAAFNLIASKPSIRYFSADHSFHDPGKIDADRVEYQWRSAHQPGARFAPASFVSGYLDPAIDLGATLAACDVPVTLVWGREADITPLSYGRDLAEAADARLVVFDDARLLPHVEHAGAFIDELASDLAAVA
ncbi:MAG: alpha/beta fold hydrolase [Halobacteriales archaeon]